MTSDALPRRGADVLEAARALQPRLRAAAPEIERAGRLPDEIVKAMQEAGVFGLTMSHSMGGPEADPMTQLEVVEALVRLGRVGEDEPVASDRWAKASASGVS